MIKSGTIKSDILEVIRLFGSASCAETTNALNLRGKRIESVGSDTVSSILSQMVKENILKIHETARGPKGGKIYILGQKAQTKRLVFKFKI